METRQDATSSPAELAQELGVAERTLRYWSRYFSPHLSAAAAPNQTSLGHRHRRYTAEDRQSLRTVRDLTARGVPLARIGDVLSGRVEREHVEATTRRAPQAPRGRRGRRPVQAADPAPLSVDTDAIDRRAIELELANRRIDELLGKIAALEADLTAARSEIELLRPAPTLAMGRGEAEPTTDQAPARERRGFGRLRWGGTRPDHRVARRIIRTMASKLMTRAELAASAGLSLQTVGEILDQRVIPDEPRIAAIAKALGVSESDLLGD